MKTLALRVAAGLALAAPVIARDQLAARRPDAPRGSRRRGRRCDARRDGRAKPTEPPSRRRNARRTGRGRRGAAGTRSPSATRSDSVNSGDDAWMLTSVGAGADDDHPGPGAFLRAAWCARRTCSRHSPRASATTAWSRCLDGRRLLIAFFPGNSFFGSLDRLLPDTSCCVAEGGQQGHGEPPRARPSPSPCTCSFQMTFAIITPALICRRASPTA